MTIYQARYFFDKARKRDKKTNEYLYPDMARAAYELCGAEDSKVSHGVGKHFGGYICICDFCGHAFTTYNSTRRFCTLECKGSYFKTRRRKVTFRKSSDVPYGAITRYCECCNTPFKIDHCQVDDGRGVFCGQNCFHKFRYVKPIWFVCNQCSTPFKAITSINGLYCCVECRDRMVIDPDKMIEPIIPEWDQVKQDQLMYNDRVVMAYRKHIDEQLDPNLKPEDYPKLTKEFVAPFKKIIDKTQKSTI